MMPQTVSLSDNKTTRQTGETITFYLNREDLDKFSEVKTWLKIKGTSAVISSFIRLMHFLGSKYREGYSIQLTKKGEKPIIVKIE